LRDFDKDRWVREETIRDYLLKRLDPETTEAFESYYLESDECFEEMQATLALMSALDRSRIEARKLSGVTVLQFTQPVGLTRESQLIHGLLVEVQQQTDRRVLIDLSRVSRVDSCSLGALMACYSDAVNNGGMVKLLNPNRRIRELLAMTGINGILECFDDEQEAVRSFAD
jgi:anti-anti-sigma factor